MLPTLRYLTHVCVAVKLLCTLVPADPGSGLNKHTDKQSNSWGKPT